MSSVSQKSFAGGEIAPELYARTDTAKYQTALRTCRNFFIQRQGGAASRPGTAFVGEVKDSSKTVKLVPFVFNSDQTYVLEFGDQYLRVIRDAAYITDLTLTITGISNANPGVVTYTGTDPSNGDEVYISGVVGAMAPNVNGRNFKIASVNAVANTFQLKDMAGVNFNTTSLGAYTSGGTAKRIYTLAPAYVEADLQTLNYNQNADVLTVVHPDYAPTEFSRTGHAAWSFGNIALGAQVADPTAVTCAPSGSTNFYWITAVGADGEEGVGSPSSTNGAATPLTISWVAAAGAVSYNVYKKSNGLYGYIGQTASTSFADSGITADLETQPPTYVTPYTGPNYPNAIGFTQQRCIFFNTADYPERGWASQTGRPKNFSRRAPSVDDDYFNFDLLGRQVNEVRHFLELGKAVIFTGGCEWVLEGNEAGTLVPGQVNPKQISANGISTLPPIVIDNTAVYIQARGGSVMKLGLKTDGSTNDSDELSVWGSHLFDGYTIRDWAYQQKPHSIVWAVRSDGVLLGLTYIQSQQVLAWHKHDTNGTVEQVCVVPEGTEDVLYLVIKRTINGETKRYVERMDTRVISEIEDYVGMDSNLAYDGTNTGSTTMTLSGGTSWTSGEELTITASAAFFTSADVGNAIHLIGSDGTLIRFSLATYTSTTVMKGYSHKTVPVSMRSTARTTWGKAVDEVTGLWHLEGKAVSVLGDGFVVGSPNNPAYATRTVTNGALTLDKCYQVIQVGLPFVCDLETLDIDTAQGEPLGDKKQSISRVTVHLHKSRGGWLGRAQPADDDDLTGFTEMKVRQSEDYDEPVELKTGKVTTNITADWESNGRVCVRQVDPLPLTVLSIVPSGLIPFRG